MARKVLIAAGAVGTAAVVGFLMQMGTGKAPNPLLATAPVDTTALAVVTIPEPEEPRVELSDITLTSSLPETGPERRPLSAPTSAPRLQAMPDPSGDRLPGAAPMPSVATEPAPETPVETADCGVTLGAESSIAALVTLTFDAPCAPYTAVTFTHDGMTFGELTDSSGQLVITVPALSEDARFTAALPDGAQAEATAEVGSLLFYDRIVLQTRGRSGLTLHALEFGADYDDPGHVWAGAPRDPSIAARGEGGFLLMLGDPSLPDAELAQVYSFPSATALHGGDVALSVEAEVLRGTCGNEVGATISQIRSGARAGRQQVSIPMPGCDAVGDFLLLKTPMNDLKIASR